MQALFAMTMDGSIFVAYAETLKPLTLGVAISAVSGIGLGLWIGLSSRFEWLFSPIFYRHAGGTIGSAYPDLGYGLWYWPDIKGLCGLHYGDAGNRSEHRKRRAQYANFHKGYGALISGD